MGMPDRPSLAGILALSVALSALPLTAPAAGAAGPAPAERARPAARQDAFVPGRVLVGFEAGAGEQGRRTAAAAVDGRVVPGTGRTRVVELDPGADVRAAARRLADRPGVAFAEPDWVRRVDACDPAVCWHLQPRRAPTRIGRRPAAPPGHHLRRLRVPGRPGVADHPGSASFATATSGTAAFEAVEGEEGTYRATLDSGDLEPGLQLELATATVDGEATVDSVPVLVLAPDDQAPGVGLVDLANDDAWRRVDSVNGDDLDDVYAVTLGRGDTLDVSIASLSPDPVAALLFDAGTTDVFGQLNQARACGGGAEVGCSTTGLHFEAETRGTYLLDVFSTGSTGDYR